MDCELGEKALQNIISNLNFIEEFTVYTGFKNAPISWNPSYLKFEEFCRSYPYFPGKPNISSPIQGREFSEFCSALGKHVGFSYCNDILTFERNENKWEMFAESFTDDDDLKKFTQTELVDFLNLLMKSCRVDITETENSWFDLRDHLSTDKRPY